MALSFHPTDEQCAAVEAALLGGNLKIKAFAGAGKTSTLQLLASAFGQRRGFYLAFNRDIAAAAARKFPMHVPARTIHAQAWCAADSTLRRRGSLDAEPPHVLATRLGIGAVQVRSVTNRMVELMPFETGRIVADALGWFCRSADPQPEASHIVVDEKIDGADAAQLRHCLLPFVRRLWEDSAAPRAHSAVTPDIVLKLWAMSAPLIDADYILFDEAQDSDGVMLSVLARQRHAQVISVGDPYQQIYEWRGAVNAMGHIHAPQCALTESFRFGPTFAALASRLLAQLGERTPLRGQDSIGSILVEDPSLAPPVDAVLCRKNVTAIGQLAAGIEMGHRPAIRMSTAEITAFADGADQLLAGQRTFRPAAFSLFENWSEAQAFARTPFGQDLLPVVLIVDELGTGCLRALAKQCTPERNADYVISTVHRAKGLEWKRVRGQTTSDSGAATEVRFLTKTSCGCFTWLSRAQHVLDISLMRSELLRLVTCGM
ncbi:MAG: UvrD-helicase domain-containing protein [Paraburkholderia tropica]|uniref:UvrD-helicase domain-containing protein n=1 Tax=Paraburkholderia tropica TaxID=92647 RepID=UPI0031019FA6